MSQVLCLSPLLKQKGLSVHRKDSNVVFEPNRHNHHWKLCPPSLLPFYLHLFYHGSVRSRGSRVVKTAILILIMFRSRFLEFGCTTIAKIANAHLGFCCIHYHSSCFISFASHYTTCRLFTQVKVRVVTVCIVSSTLPTYNHEVPAHLDSAPGMASCRHRTRAAQ